MREAIQNFLEVIGIALLNLAGVYGVYCINKFATYLKTKTEKIESEKQKALVDSAISRVSNLVQVAVNSAEQSTAKELRELVKNGVKDRSELLAIGQNVVENVYSQLTPEVENLVKSEVQDVKSYILDLVEESVGKLKVQ